LSTQEAAPHRTSEALRIARDGAAIRVTWRGALSRRDIEQLEEILDDLVEGQGNLSLTVDLPDVAVVDLELLEVLVVCEQRLETKSGTLAVTTAIGAWMPTSPSA
jgi:hypothetical protein